jgi:hypothetical protein
MSVADPEAVKARLVGSRLVDGPPLADPIAS